MTDKPDELETVCFAAAQSILNTINRGNGIDIIAKGLINLIRQREGKARMEEMKRCRDIVAKDWADNGLNVTKRRAVKYFTKILGLEEVKG